MRIMMVDDERLALMRMEKLLREIEGIEVIDKFTDIELAIEQIKHDQPDVVFLDIEMPEMNGMVAAGYIHDIAPSTEIIFVTAYDHYALEAFNVQALDYITKPVSKERLMKTIQYIHKRKSPDSASSEMPVAYLRCLGRLQVQWGEQKPQMIKPRTAKIKELIAYLLHKRNQIVSKDALIQLLWPEVDEQKGMTNLHTSIYRMRQLIKELGLDDALKLQYIQFGYILELKNLMIDVDERERKQRQLPPISQRNLAEHHQFFEEYSGDYFGEDQYFWAETERQRLKMMWLQHGHELAEYYLNNDRPMDALSVYHRVVEHDPMLEEVYLALMRIYEKLNDQSSVDLQYKLMVSTLKKEADAKPGHEVTEWYRRWQQTKRNT